MYISAERKVWVALIAASVAGPMVVSSFISSGENGGIGSFIGAFVPLTGLLGLMAMSPKRLYVPLAPFLLVASLLVVILLAEARSLVTPPDTFGGLANVHRAAVLLNLVLLMFVASLLPAHCTEGEILRGLQVASLAVACLTALQWSQISGFSLQTRANQLWDWNGAGSPPFNHFASTALFSGALALAFRSHWLRLPLLAYSALAVFSFWSRTSILTLVVVLIAFELLRAVHAGKGVVLRVAVSLYGATVVLALLLFLVPGLSDWLANDVLDLYAPDRGIGSGFTGRTSLWIESLGIWWRDSPVLGVGFRLLPLYAHNGYVMMLAELGVFGLAWFAVILAFGLCVTLRTPGNLSRVSGAFIVGFLFWNIFEARPLNAGHGLTLAFYFLAFQAISRQGFRRAEQLRRPVVSGSAGRPSTPLYGSVAARR